MASEQATNSQVSPEQSAESSLYKFFGGEEKPPAPASKSRDPENGKFVRTEQAEKEEPVNVEEPGTEAAEQETQAQSEEVEVEIEGEKYLVPKKISERFIQHSDYTRKTQDIAELRRVTVAEREASNIERAFTQATAQERDQVSLIDAQIAQFRHVNWQQLETQDLLRTRAQLDQLKETRAEVSKTIEAKRAQFDERIKSVTQEAISAGMKYVQHHIKGYDQPMQSKLFEYGRAEGYTQAELERIIDPRIIVSLWKSSQWDSLQASNPSVTKKAQQAAPTVRPGATQTRPNRIQQLNQAFQKAGSPKDKRAAAEDYFAARLSGKG